MRYDVAMIRVLETAAELEAFRGDWEALERRAAQSPFQTFCWAEQAWGQVLARIPGNRLFVVVAVEAGAGAQVILPCYLARGVLHFLLDVHADHGDALAAPDALQSRHWKALCAFLRSDRRVRGFDLRRLPGASPLFQALTLAFPEAALSKMGGYAVLRAAQAEDVIGTFRHLTSLQRKALRRALRRTEGLTLRRFSAAGGKAFPREALVSLRERMIAQGVRQRDFLPEALLAVAEGMFRAGLCEVAGLYAGETAQVLNVLLRTGGKTLFWLVAAESPQMPSLFNVRYVAEAAKAAPLAVDFGTGVYPYKCLAFCPEVHSSFALYWRRGVWGLACMAARGLLRWARDAARAPRGWWA